MPVVFIGGPAIAEYFLNDCWMGKTLRLSSRLHGLNRFTVAFFSERVGNVGLLPLVSHLVMIPDRLRGRKLKNEYERSKPSTTVIQVGGYDATYKLSDAMDYCRLRGHREAKVARALLGRVRPGDLVWDIGANIGLFTVPLAKAVGDYGEVYAFEPVPACFDRLLLNVHLNALSNVHLEKIALDRECSNRKMKLCSIPLLGSHHFIDEGSDDYEETITVQVLSGDGFRTDRSLPVPAVIKIDVEGAEEDVLIGLERTLSSSKCRSVFCEVHFSVLEAKGLAKPALRIERFLKGCGLSKIEWIDRSHVAAHR